MDETPIKSVRLAVLRWMGALEGARGGYTLLGVAGWAHSADVAKALGGLAKDALTHLARERQLDRENIALPARVKPVWLYRINARGARTLGAEAHPVRTGSAAPPVAILSDSQTAALETMRAARHDGTRLRFTQREQGWRTVPEIRSAPTVRPRRVMIRGADVDVLARLGLLEKRVETTGGRGHEATVYRITAAGEAVERLVWRDPEDHLASASGANPPPRGPATDAVLGRWTAGSG